MNEQTTLFSTPAKAKKKCAASWSADEIAFAERMIACWSACMKDKGPRANYVRHNRFIAIQLYRFLHGPDNGEPKMTEGDVELGIEAYANDPYNDKHLQGRRRAFADWLQPDNVDAQLRRFKKQRGNPSRMTPKNADQIQRGRVIRIFAHDGWSDVYRRGETNGKPIGEYIDTLRHVIGKTDQSQHAMWIRRLAQTLAAINALKPEQHDALFERAYRAAQVMDAALNPRKADNLMHAMACALHAKFGEAIHTMTEDPW